MAFPWLFHGPHLLRKTVFGHSSWLFRGFFVAFPWLFRGFFVALTLGKFYAYSPWKRLLRKAIPAKVWALSGKENGCWKIGRAFGNAAGFSPPRPPQSS